MIFVLLGVLSGVAKAMSSGASWSGKVNRLLDLADKAPRDPEAQLAVMCHRVAELIANGQPLSYDWLCAGWPREKGLGSGTADPLKDGGLGDIVLHPDFANNKTVYVSYVEAGPNETRGAVVARGTLNLDAPAIELLRRRCKYVIIGDSEGEA